MKASGNVFVQGVLVTGGTGTATTEIFLPSTGKWVEAEPLIG